MRPARPALASDVYGLVSMRSAVGQRACAPGLPVTWTGLSSCTHAGPVGGVAGFGVAGGAHGAGAAGVGGATRGWGSLAGAAPSPRASGMDRGFGSDGHFGDDRHGADGRWMHGGARRGDGARSNDKPLRLEDVFNKTKTKPEIYWKPNARAVRDRRLDELRAAQVCVTAAAAYDCWCTCLLVHMPAVVHYCWCVHSW